MLSSADPQIADLIDRETKRQTQGVTLIPSENHTSRNVLDALATPFSDKYAEGYPKKRYYAGNEVVDDLEILVQDRAKQLFGVPYVNVQPYSGSPANLATLFAISEPKSTIMGLELAHGGHLTHGYEKNITGRFWRSISYHLKPDGSVDLEEMRSLAKQERPSVIFCGATAMPRAIPFKEIAAIADEVGAYLVADTSHITGLIIGKVHESPVPYAHIITTTTHKTLRGPRGALIMVTQKGLEKDPELPQKIDKAIIPGLQGGPHMNTIAGIGVALHEASFPAFTEYANQVVKNAHTLAEALISSGFSLVSGGTDNHLLLLDLTATGVGRGIVYHEALERIGIFANKNVIPGDPSSPLYPSGLRLGTPAATTRGMTGSDMKQIASWISQVHERTQNVYIPSNKEERIAALATFRKTLQDDSFYETLRQEVRTLCERYPIPATLS